MPLLALLAVAGYLHMADAQAAADRYGARTQPYYDASGYSVGRCQRKTNRTVTCTVNFYDFPEVGTDWGEVVDVRLKGRHITAHSRSGYR